MATAQEIAAATDQTEAYARMILAGRRPSLATALRIYDRLGEKFGPLRDLTPREIETARRMVA